MAKSPVCKRNKALSLLDQTQGLLRRFHLYSKKSLGQHFLVDEEVRDLVVASAGITAGDTVVEVGPGLGVLTRELAERAGRLIAVELDEKLAQILKQTLAELTNVSIINRDVLEVEPGAILGELEPVLPPDFSRSYKMVANLPYYITSPVLRHFLEASVKPRLMVVMLQKEVAETIVARPGDLSLLAISVQFYGKPEIVSRVPARCFYPEPEVDSAVLRIDVFPEPSVAVSDVAGFFDLVRAGFSSPRKQLHNALMRRLSLPREKVVPMLEKAGIDPMRRAQTLSLEEWARLWEIYSESKT